MEDMASKYSALVAEEARSDNYRESGPFRRDKILQGAFMPRVSEGQPHPTDKTVPVISKHMVMFTQRNRQIVEDETLTRSMMESGDC